MLVSAIDLQPQTGLARVANLTGRVQWTDRSRGIERLADFPRAAHFAHFHLQVAAGHVQAHGVTEDVFVGLFQRNVAPAFADRRDQLDLVVVVSGFRRVGQLQGLAVGHRHHGIGRLAEEERRLAVGVEAHFTGMGGVVAAHAVHTAHREALVTAGNRQAGGGGRFKQVSHGRGSLDQWCSRASRSSPRASCTGRSE
ncbi:hypothetical protein D3C76_854960 [compost metagenome]